MLIALLAPEGRRRPRRAPAPRLGHHPRRQRHRPHRQDRGGQLPSTSRPARRPPRPAASSPTPPSTAASAEQPLRAARGRGELARPRGPPVDRRVAGPVREPGLAGSGGPPLSRPTSRRPGRRLDWVRGVGGAPKVSTPWVTEPGSLHRTVPLPRRCQLAAGERPHHPGDTRPVVRETLGPTWGLHLVDVNIALGNLVSLVGDEGRAYTGKKLKTLTSTPANTASCASPPPRGPPRSSSSATGSPSRPSRTDPSLWSTARAIRPCPPRAGTRRRRWAPAWPESVSTPSTSPLCGGRRRRRRRWCEILGLAPVVEPDLREVFVGEWEGGLLRKKVLDGTRWPCACTEEQRWDVIPGAEPASVVSRRVRRAVERIAAAHRRPDGWSSSATAAPSASSWPRPPGRSPSPSPEPTTDRSPTS
jgi:hypothetical protein